MIRTGAAYLASIRDDRRVVCGGARVADVTRAPEFAPMIAARARVYDLAQEAETAPLLTTLRAGEPCTVAAALPYAQADWWAKRRAVEVVLDRLGGLPLRLGDETSGEFWALWDAAAALDALDPRFGAGVVAKVEAAAREDLFEVTAAAEPAGTAPLCAVRESDAGVVVRGAKIATAAAVANRVLVRPAPGAGPLAPEAALGFLCDLARPGLTITCAPGAGGDGLALDEIDCLLHFDEVLIPWENLFFYRQPEAARLLGATRHRYSAFPFLVRLLRQADLLLGAVLGALRQAGREADQGVQDSLVELAAYRTGIEAHLSAAVAMAERSPGGLMMPAQAMLYAGRMAALEGLGPAMSRARLLCGGALALSDAGGAAGGAAGVEDRARLMGFARDLINSAQAGHRLSYFGLAQGAPHAQRAALYGNFDFEGPLDLVRRAAGLGEIAAPAGAAPPATAAPAPRAARWFSMEMGCGCAAGPQP